MGKQASGKGTIIEELTRKHNLIHLSTGDLFREEFHKGTKLGIQLQKYMHEGQLVPDDVTIKILNDRISKEKKGTGFLFDGFPRDIEQAKLLDKQIKISKVIYLNIDDKLAIHRITGRRICSNDKCAKTYSINPEGFPKPKKEGICDECGTKLYQRDDDKEEIVKERLNIFKEKTLPVIEHYKKEGLVVEIDATRKPEEIFVDLNNIFTTAS